MGTLVGAHPGIDVAEVVVLALPAEGAGSGPRLDDEFVGLLESLPVVVGFHVVGHAFPSGAAHPAGDQAAPGNHVNHRQLFHQPQGVVPDGDDVAQEHNLGAVGDAGQDGGLHVHRAAHAEGRAVVLVEHEAVEAHLLGVDFFVQVAVVEVGAELSVVDFVADAQVHDGLAGGAEVAGLGVLVGPFGEVSDKHFRSPDWRRRG